MAVSPADSWNRARQAFADQFEKYGNGFVYRRSQKGEAIPVSAEERERFIDEFNRSIRRTSWILTVGVVLILGGAILLSLARGSDLSEGVIVAAVLVALIPYFAYYRWVWAAPARELGRRTPVARERSPDEVKRIRFARITYGQLASAALGGVAIPFFMAARHNVFSRENWVWLIFGGGLVLLAAVQALRKWRLEQDHPSTEVMAAPSIVAPSIVGIPEPAEQARSQSKNQLWRYVPFALLVLAAVFLALGGKRFANVQSFWPVFIAGVGAWALFTVWRGFTNRRIEPFIRGFYSTYERETEPKRFWASMAWNGLFGGVCICLAFAAMIKAPVEGVQDRCYNQHREYSPQAAADACTQLIDGKARLTYLSKADAFLDRAIWQERLNDRAAALNDYSSAIRLQPDDYYPYADRGLLFLNMMKFDQAIPDFTRAHELDPKSPWPLANRGIAYAWKNDRERAEADLDQVRKIDPANPVVLHGEAVMSMNSGNLEEAIGQLTSALKLNPHDYWALQTRADAYQQAGDFTQAQADREQLQLLMRESNTADLK